MEAGLVAQERTGVGHVHGVGYAHRIIKKKKHVPKVKRPKKTVSKSLQLLFLSCREVFKGPGTVPSPQDVQRLTQIIDNMKPEDVGLSGDLHFFNPENVVQGNPRVVCTTVYSCDNFSICIFFIPANGVIPLHNHPGMTVFSKLLLGKMHIKSYDWPDSSSESLPSPSHVRLAKLKADGVYTASCNTSVLYPTTGGNMHAFTAITPCAVLDVLGPPYSKGDDGRDCSYYKEHPYTAFSNEENQATEESDCYGWLEEIEVPENSKMDGIEYLGPQVRE